MATIKSEVEVTLDVTLEEDGVGVLVFGDPEVAPVLFSVTYDALYEEVDQLYGNGRGGVINDPEDCVTVMKMAEQLRDLADDLANLAGETL